MWNSVLPAPVRLTDLLSSLTTWPSSNVHVAFRVPGTLAAGSLVLVETEASMVSLGAKVLDCAPTFMYAPMVLPRSTAVTEAELAGAGAGSGIGPGTGSVVACGVCIAACHWPSLQQASPCDRP